MLFKLYLRGLLIALVGAGLIALATLHHFPPLRIVAGLGILVTAGFILDDLLQLRHEDKVLEELTQARQRREGE